MGGTTHRPSVWCSKHYFFIISYRLRALKTLHFYFCKNLKKMVSESFVPATQQPSVLYWRLSDFCWSDLNYLEAILAEPTFNSIFAQTNLEGIKCTKAKKKVWSKNPTIYNIVLWFTGLLGQMIVNQGSDIPSIISFIISYRLRALKTHCFIFVNL